MATSGTRATLLASFVSFAGLSACDRPRPVSANVPPPLARTLAPGAERPGIPVLHVEVSPARSTNTFRPILALGAAIDRLPRAAAEAMYAPEPLEKALSSGWGAVTYRLNTELHIEAWHWNPRGTWSDPTGRGYFTGDAAGVAPIRHSFGYPLPRRGSTRNEGTETEGYSRLTDGDAQSFWKSNPYLSHAYTGESDGAFPQWIVVDLGERREVDAIGISWAAPYAKSYEVQYWTGEDAMKKPAGGQWTPFPDGKVRSGKGGAVTLKLGASPIATRFVRVAMTESSETCVDAQRNRGVADRRDCVGFAIYEVQLGTLSTEGGIRDLLRHSPDQSQSATHCSSVDPWHRPADIDPLKRDQTGLDFFYASGITRGLPAMLPVAVLYGTPEDSAAEIAYLEKRGYPISYIELGEEADGQYVTPEHYAALYLQWAAALHKVDPKLELGGPAFTGVNEDIQAWPDARGSTSFFARFLNYLKAHERLGDLAFMSFEHYPFEPCKATWDNLYDEPQLIRHILDVWRSDGLPSDVPLFATEVNISSQASQVFVDTFGGLWLADYVGAFLTAGGKETFYFHYLSGALLQECDSTWGAFSMFAADRVRGVREPASQYFAARLLTQEWVQPGSETHRVFPVVSDAVDAAGRTVVTGYAVARPDGQWSVLLVNKDPTLARSLRVGFRDSVAERDLSFSGVVATATFGAENYVWHPKGPDGYPDPDGPIVRSTQPGGPEAVYTLPKASITVLRGTIRINRPR